MRPPTLALIFAPMPSRLDLYFCEAEEEKDMPTVLSAIQWFPLLRDASPEQRDNYEVSGAGFGIHWPDLDEDLSIAGLMAGVDLRAA